MAAAINSIISLFYKDAVAIYDQNFKQIFQNARPLKAVVKEEAKVMEHPIETGATITDHRVILPVEIEMSMIVGSSNYQDVYNQIRQYYLNSTLVIVQTRSGVYPNQLIAGIPHEEDPSQYAQLIIAIKFKEAQFVTTQTTVIPKNPTNTNTVNRGNQQPKTISQPTQDTYLDQLAKKANII